MEKLMKSVVDSFAIYSAGKAGDYETLKYLLSL